MRAVCGLDVHKDSVYLCILTGEGELIEKVFEVLTFRLQQMRDLLLAHNVDKVSYGEHERLPDSHLASPCAPFPHAPRQPLFHQA